MHTAGISMNVTASCIQLHYPSAADSGSLDPTRTKVDGGRSNLFSTENGPLIKSERRGITQVVDDSAPRLEQLHWVARRVVENDLCAARPSHAIIRAEGNPRRTQPRNFCREIGHL